MNEREERQPIRVLLAEDNDDDAVLFEEAFRQSDFVEVLSVVPDGEEILAYLRREGRYRNAPRPQLVILDLNMPKKNGLEVLREMKADPTLRALPIVVLTSSNAPEDMNASYGSGASTFITKPALFGEFAGAMRHFERYWGTLAQLPVG